MGTARSLLAVALWSLLGCSASRADVAATSSVNRARAHDTDAAAAASEFHAVQPLPQLAPSGTTPSTPQHSSSPEVPAARPAVGWASGSWGTVPTTIRSNHPCLADYGCPDVPTEFPQCPPDAHAIPPSATRADLERFIGGEVVLEGELGVRYSTGLDDAPGFCSGAGGPMVLWWSSEEIGLDDCQGSSCPFYCYGDVSMGCCRFDGHFRVQVQRHRGLTVLASGVLAAASSSNGAHRGRLTILGPQLCALPVERSRGNLDQRTIPEKKRCRSYQERQYCTAWANDCFNHGVWYAEGQSLGLSFSCLTRSCERGEWVVKGKECFADLLMVRFARNSVTMIPGQDAMLAELANVLKQEPKADVIAHADASENDPESLSAKRAERVRDELVRRGVPEAILKLKSVGARVPRPAPSGASGVHSAVVEFRFGPIEFQ